MTELLTHFFGALYGAMALILGAFGAHALKKMATAEQLASFETGVRYQFYHALLLVVLGYGLGFQHPVESWVVTCFMVGTPIFSWSIFGLVWSDIRGNKWRFLGPVTPIGGLILAIGWLLLVYNSVRFIF
jgi:uncharacterized membrane protein YgdD (TMEM256/DUF423 family)